MAQRHLSSRKSRDSHFRAKNRDQDRPAIGALSRSKAKGKSNENAKKTALREEICMCWATKGQCSFADSSAFKHEPNKKGNGKGRPRSPSSTRSPHRNSKSDGKGGDDGKAKSTPKLTGKRPSGKANRPPCFHFKRGNCQKEQSCTY